MNIKQIQYALELAETLNFSQVAEKLGISQPALSKQIKHLEKELGVELFDRNHSPLTITPAGEYFVRNAGELVYKEEQMRKALMQFQTGQSGRLVIGITPFRSIYLMPELIKKIHSKYPGVRVSVQEVPSPQLRKETLEGKYDFSIVNLPVDTSVLDVIPLKKDILVVAVHKSIAGSLPSTSEGEYAEIDFSQLKELPFVVLSCGQELRQLFDRLCASVDFQPSIVAEVMGVTSAWSMAQAGVGATLLPLQFAHSQKIDSNMSLYIVKNSLYSRQPVVATRRGQFKTPYADYAIRLLTEKD